MRQRPSIRTRYRFDGPPKDGSEIVVPCSFVLTVYWCEQMKQWVLVRPLKIETLDEVIRWKKK